MGIACTKLLVNRRKRHAVQCLTVLRPVHRVVNAVSGRQSSQLSRACFRRDVRLEIRAAALVCCLHAIITCVRVVLVTLSGELGRHCIGRASRGRASVPGRGRLEQGVASNREIKLYNGEQWPKWAGCIPHAQTGRNR